MRKIFSAGNPSFSYIAKKKNGNIAAIIIKTAAVLPIVPFENMYIGMPITAATPKQINWRFVIFKAILDLTLFKSFGTLVYANIAASFLRAYTAIPAKSGMRCMPYQLNG